MTKRNGNKNFDDLHKKTILDFTNDKDYLDSLMIETDEDRAIYIADMRANPSSNAFQLLELAEQSEDEELKKAVKSQFKNDIESFFNED